MENITRERLLKLCAFMESLPAEADQHFHMRTFIYHQGDHEHEIAVTPTVDQLLSCGTTACALGWATTIPEFQALGLRFSKGAAHVEGELKVFPGIEDEEDDEGRSLWENLFEHYHRDATPKEWATRVRKLIAEWRV